MSKIIRTQKPSVLPFYAAALVFVVLCAVLPVYKLWALLVALGGAAVAFGVAQKTCPPRVVEREVPLVVSKLQPLQFLSLLQFIPLRLAIKHQMRLNARSHKRLSTALLRLSLLLHLFKLKRIR